MNGCRPQQPGLLTGYRPRGEYRSIPHPLARHRFAGCVLPFRRAEHHGSDRRATGPTGNRYWIALDVCTKSSMHGRRDMSIACPHESQSPTAPPFEEARKYRCKGYFGCSRRLLVGAGASCLAWQLGCGFVCTCIARWSFDV